MSLFTGSKSNKRCAKEIGGYWLGAFKRTLFISYYRPTASLGYSRKGRKPGCLLPCIFSAVVGPVPQGLSVKKVRKNYIFEAQNTGLVTPQATPKITPFWFGTTLLLLMSALLRLIITLFPLIWLNIVIICTTIFHNSLPQPTACPKRGT